jgi:phosphoglycolate phosphatase
MARSSPASRRPGGVIFDLDGTLADSLADIASAMNRMLQAHGLPAHPASAYRAFVGEGVRKLVERALPPGTESMREAFVAAYQADYAEHLLDETRLFPGIPEVLDGLQSAAVPVAVLSNKPHLPTRRLVDALCSRWAFRAIVGERPGVPRKPDPTSALALADALAAAPETVAFVGDTGVDMLTARAASMRPVGVLWGFRPQEVLASGAEAARTGEELAHFLGVVDVVS